MVLLWLPNGQAPFVLSTFELFPVILGWFDHQDSHPSIASVIPTVHRYKVDYTKIGIRAKMCSRGC